MARVQLALNVVDLDSSIDFYTRLFGTGPHKTRPGYANFAVDDPPLKLVLFEGAGEPGTLNHLGVEMETTDEVQAADGRLRSEGLDTVLQEDTTCCFAVQDKTWVTDPSGREWEIYTILDDAPDHPHDQPNRPLPVDLTSKSTATVAAGGMCGPGCC